MGFLNSLFHSGKVQSNWSELLTMDDLDQAVKQSFKEPVILFKHSVTCGISASAKARIEDGFERIEKAPFFYLDLLAHRDISNEIARRFEVTHQSPQAIVLKNGKAVYKSSHFSISPEDLAKQLN